MEGSPMTEKLTKLDVAAHLANTWATIFIFLLIQAKEQEKEVIDLISSRIGVSFQSGLEFPSERTSMTSLQSL